MLLVSIYNLIQKTYYILISLMLNLLYLVKNVGNNSHGESNFEVPFDRGFVNV